VAGYFVVTGATTGIGHEIARLLAQKGYHLVLVARNETRLQEAAKALSHRYGITCQTIAADLSNPSSSQMVYEACHGLEVEGLVNNAGMGLFGDFTSISLEEELPLIQLNVLSVHQLSKYFLKDFLKADKGMLLNVASTAAFQSGPFMASYYASKAYVLSLTEAMAEEARHLGKNVTISCLAPGPVQTGFHERAGLKGSGRLQTAKEVANYGIKEWFKGKPLIVPGQRNRTLLFLNRFIPRGFARRLVLKNQLNKKK